MYWRNYYFYFRKQMTFKMKKILLRRTSEHYRWIYTSMRTKAYTHVVWIMGIAEVDVTTGKRHSCHGEIIIISSRLQRGLRQLCAVNVRIYCTSTIMYVYIVSRLLYFAFRTFLLYIHLFNVYRLYSSVLRIINGYSIYLCM